MRLVAISKEHSVIWERGEMPGVVGHVSDEKGGRGGEGAQSSRTITPTIGLRNTEFGSKGYGGRGDFCS
jgi:hypothetical protein